MIRRQITQKKDNIMNINEIIAESAQLDEIDWKGIQKKAAQWQKGAQKFKKNVADTGSALGGAASALGGAAQEVGRQFIAKPIAATYGAAKDQLSKAANVATGTYGDIKKGVQAVGQGASTVARDVGQGVANVVGGTAGGIGSVAGGATTGIGRAAAHGFNTGVKNVGGDAVDRMQTNIMKEPGASASWADPSSPDYVGRREVARRQAQGQTSSAGVAPGYKSITQAQPTVAPMKTTPQWTGRKPEAKLTPSQYISRIGVDESLSWSKSFDPGMTVWKRMHESQ